VRGRIILWIVVLGAIFFAIQGGEYSTVDLWRQRQLKKLLTAQTDSLSRAVDSLAVEARLIKTDRATQERVAREQFGMVRGEKEILYRISSGSDSSEAKKVP
jgi:cell division protein FtsB